MDAHYRICIVDESYGDVLTVQQCVDEMTEAGTYLVPTLAALFNILENPQKVPEYVLEKVTRIAARHQESIQMFHSAGGKIALGTLTCTEIMPRNCGTW